MSQRCPNCSAQTCQPSEVMFHATEENWQWRILPLIIHVLEVQIMPKVSQTQGEKAQWCHGERGLWASWKPSEGCAQCDRTSINCLLYTHHCQ